MFHTYTKKIILSLLLPLSLCAQAQVQQSLHTSEKPLTSVTTIFGTCQLEHAVIKDLIKHKAMRRLKEIDQHGPSTFFLHQPTFNRFEHSVGVFHLLKKFHAPFKEQVAGLLHDASHTVGSHVADTLFKTGRGNAYQDNIHNWFLEKMGVDTVLKRHGLTIEAVSPKDDSFKALERKLPDLCADRIQYNLHTGLVFGRITEQDVTTITNDLVFENDEWFFVNQKSARMLADLSVYFTEFFWGSAENVALHHWFSTALKRALALGLITFDNIHFGTDAEVLKILRESKDSVIQDMLICLEKPADHFKAFEDTTRFDLFCRPKFMVVNPLVKHEGKLVRLTQLDPDFKKEYERMKEFVRKGHKIRFTTARAKSA